MEKIASKKREVQEREDICILMIHVDIYQKSVKYYKAIFLQLKRKKFKLKKQNNRS